MFTIRNRFATAAFAGLALLATADLPRAQKGLGFFYDVAANGKMSFFKGNGGWRQTWHEVVPGDWGGTFHTDLLFYDRQRGDAKFFRTDGKGNLTLLRYHTGWRRTWDKIIPGQFGGDSRTDLLFYDARARLARIYSVSSTGVLTLLRQHTGWQDWDVILPISMGATNHTDLFFYSRTRGEAKFYFTDGNGRLVFVKRYQFQRNWDNIVAGKFDADGYSDLFFYHRITGDGKIYALDPKANLKLLKSYTTFRKSWDVIVPMRIGGSSHEDLWFYDRTAGIARAALVHNGAMTVLPQQTIGSRWHRIVPGYFNFSGLQDVLCYDFTHYLRIHAIRCMNANGTRAASISPAQVQQWVDRANRVYASAGIQLVFDPETDYEEYKNDVLNRLDVCTKHSTQKSCDASKNLATAVASTKPCKIVVFFRYGNGSKATGGGFSNPAGNYIAMPGFSSTGTTRYYHNKSHPWHNKSVQNIKLFAHELGHYLGLPHTFPGGIDYGTSTDPHGVIIAYMLRWRKKTLESLDGDRHLVWDTPPDLHAKYYTLKGWNPANIFQETRIYAPQVGIDLTFNPDRHNVMSYFGINDDYIRISPDQQRRVREFVHEPHRKKLLDTCSIPGLIKPFGISCRSGMRHDAVGSPGLGKQVTYQILGGPKGKLASLAIGLSKSRWGAIPLPFHLSVLGAPGCFAYVDQLTVLRSVISVYGTARYSLRVPTDPKLIGVKLYTQGFCSDPGANAAGLVVTNGLETRVGG